MFAFLFRLLALSAVAGLVCGQPQLNLTFVLQTASAPFTPRWWPSVESYPNAINVGGVTLRANSLIMFGGSTNVGGGETHLNDVWGSEDDGRTWKQLSAGAFTATRFPGYAIDSKARLFKVAGSDGSQVWMSTNAVTWTQQTATAQFPGRTFPDLQVDSKDVLYLVGGSGPSTGQSGMNDVWKSTNQGVSWSKTTNMPFPSPPGRSTGFLVNHVSRQTKLDILTYMGGYGSVNRTAGSIQYYNDIWMSSDAGAKWLLITENAPWSKRDNFNAEVTRDGAIVVVAGYNDAGGDLNDVWVSMDGGWTWGQCIKESQWTDRRWLSTVLDSQGYLLVVAGDNNNTGPRVPRNDVWRSTFSLNDNPALSRACGVEIPACGVGLTCVPGQNTKVENGRVTCPAIRDCNTDNLAFTVTTAQAAWPARHSPGVEFLKTAVTVGGVRYNTPNSMVLYGGTGPSNELLNDVWLSSNSGLTWQQVSASATFPGSAWSGHIIDSKNRIYKIGGERWGSNGQPNTGNGEVYMSNNGGQTWTQQRPTSDRTALPPRSFPDVYVDKDDYLYVAAGLEVGGPGLNDVWRSTDAGKNWNRQGGMSFGSPPGRSSASLLIHESKVLGKQVMYYFGGYSRGGSNPNPVWHNDVWVSSDLGKQWRQLTDRAPWSARNNFNAEITDDGLIVFAGGYFNNQQALNDVWISVDGGYTWGQCVAEAAFSDRRWHATAMDKSGNLFILGGEEYEHGQYVKTNDVWKSSFSFSVNNRAKLERACAIKYPQCYKNAGLACWPVAGQQPKRDSYGRVTCNTLTTFTQNGCSLCDPDDPTSCGADTGSNNDWDESTGVEGSTSGGMGVGMIALIVVLVLAGVVALGGYYWYSRKQASSQNIIPGVGSDGLLGTGHHTSDSTAEGASNSNYYSQDTNSTA